MIDLFLLAAFVQLMVGISALAGIFLGTISFFYPAHSIELYQFLMQIFNWDVQPIDYPGELRRTKIFGVVMLVLSIAILVILFRPQLVLIAS